MGDVKATRAVTPAALRTATPALGSAGAASRDRVARSLGVRARIVSFADRIDVRILPMDHVDLDVRRAGLDVDPGGVPSLRRRVTFTSAESPDSGEP